MLARTKAICAEHAAREPTFLSTKSCSPRAAEVRTRDQARPAPKERIDDVLAED